MGRFDGKGEHEEGVCVLLPGLASRVISKVLHSRQCPLRGNLRRKYETGTALEIFIAPPSTSRILILNDVEVNAR